MSHTKPPQAQSKQKVEAVKCTKPAQGQKNTSFELQSAPNLHRDTKNKSFELQSAPNLHRDKKKQVLNFKVHQTCTGTQKNKSFEFQSAPNPHRDKKNKKTKTSQSTWEGATIPLKFFLFFCPCAGLVHFEVQNVCFFSLCRFGAL